jgi:hypothetical protein
VDSLQLRRLARFDPVAIYQACKEIDDYPGEGTFPIFGSRVLKFYGLVSRQFFYEPVGCQNSVPPENRVILDVGL